MSYWQWPVPPESAQFVLVHLENIVSIDNDLPGSRLNEPVDMSYKGGFTRPGKPHNDLDSTGWNVNVHIAECQYRTMPIEQFLLGNPILDQIDHFSRILPKDFV